jgi:hypothetical protein
MAMTFDSIIKDIQDQEKYKNESTLESAKRQAAQYTSRGAEGILGLPGAAKSAWQSSLDDFNSFLGIDKIVGSMDEMNSSVLGGKPEKGSVQDIIFNPPNPQDIRQGLTKKVAKSISGDESYLEPKSEFEEKVGEFSQDLATFFLPGNKMSLPMKIITPLLGNLAKEGVKYLGADEGTAQKVKSGLMLMTSMAGASNPREFANNRIQQAKNLVPENATINARPFENQIIQIRNQLRKGLNTPDKSSTFQAIENLGNQIDPITGRMNFRSLMQARDDINRLIDTAGGFDVPTSIKNATVRNLNNLKSRMIDTIDTTLQRFDPQAAELYRSGYEAASVLHQSNAISRFIEKVGGKYAFNPLTKTLFGGGAVASGAAFFPKAAIGAATGFPLYQTGKLIYRVANSPTLAHYYGNVIRDATIQNTPSLLKNLKRFDKELEKSIEKDRKLSFEEVRDQLIKPKKSNQ